MALARVALKNLNQKIAFVNPSVSQVKYVEKQRWCSELLKRFSTEAEAADGKGKSKVAVSESGKKSKLFPRRRRRGSLWRHRDPDDFAPVLFENLPSGLGSALLQVRENITRLFENLNMNPSKLMERYKEEDKSYRIRYDVPGLGKEDVKIMEEDEILTIKGEHKEEKEGSDDDDKS
ncbi:hypothetical protein BC332_01673 [Capsicum chinense]|nr:hypothetical protein BC332_01673 [Capsicum chinense]